MSTFATMKTNVSRDLRDTGNVTFSLTDVGDLINAALAEIGRIAPRRFQQDITPVADSLEYPLQTIGTSQSLTTPFGVASTNVLTSTTHGLVAGDAIRFLTLVGGDGLVVGLPYYIIASGLTADDFKVAPIVSGTEVDFDTNLSSGTFARVGVDDVIPEIEVMRVELWDSTTTPHTPVTLVQAASAEYVNYSEVGWKVWDGVLEIPRWIPVYLAGSESDYVLRVWGYAPYTPLVNANDVVGLSNEREWALRAYCRVEALRRLVSERDLFSQWQIRSNNTDVSPAALMNALSLAEADWNRRSRQIAVLREAP
jgi:hypothetical protein